MFSDASTFRRTGVGFALILAPLLFLVGDILSPAWSDDTAEYVAEVAGNPGAQEASGALYTLAFALMVVGAIGIANCIRGRGVVLANIAVAMAVIGLGMFPALTITSVIDAVAVESIAQADYVALIDEAEETAGFIAVLILTLALSLVSLLLIAVAVGRSGLAPWWVAGVLIAATVALVAGGSSQALAIAASALQLIGFGYLGLRILRMANTEWERPPHHWTEASAGPAAGAGTSPG